MYILKDDVIANIQLEADDKFGNLVGQLEKPATFALSDDSFGALTPSADGMACVFESNGKLGSFQVQVSAEVAGKVIQGVADLQVVAGAAASLKVTVSQPEATPA